MPNNGRTSSSRESRNLTGGESTSRVGGLGASWIQGTGEPETLPQAQLVNGSWVSVRTQLRERERS